MEFSCFQDIDNAQVEEMEIGRENESAENTDHESLTQSMMGLQVKDKAHQNGGGKLRVVDLSKLTSPTSEKLAQRLQNFTVHPDAMRSFTEPSRQLSVHRKPGTFKKTKKPGMLKPRNI